MRMAAHVDRYALKEVAGVRGVKRIDLRMLGSVKVIQIVALNGLSEKRQTQR